MRSNVMIADDRALFRDAMRTLMEGEDDMRVVADLESAADVVPRRTGAGRTWPC